MPLHDSSQLCVCMCVRVYVCERVCARVHTCVHACVYMYASICMTVCVHVCACRQACVCVCVCGGRTPAQCSLGRNPATNKGASVAGLECWLPDPLAEALFPTAVPSSETVVLMRLWTPLQRTPHGVDVRVADLSRESVLDAELLTRGQRCFRACGTRGQQSDPL